MTSHKGPLILIRHKKKLNLNTGGMTKWMKGFPYFWYLGMFPVISPIIIFTLQNFSSSCYAAQNGCDFQQVQRISVNKTSCHKKHSNDIPPRLKVSLFNYLKPPVLMSICGFPTASRAREFIILGQVTWFCTYLSAVGWMKYTALREGNGSLFFIKSSTTVHKPQHVHQNKFLLIFIFLQTISAFKNKCFEP